MADMGPVWSCRVLVRSSSCNTMDFFDEEWQTKFRLFKGPEMCTASSSNGELRVANIKFGRWVGSGLKPFDSFGRLLHVQPLCQVMWDTSNCVSPTRSGVSELLWVVSGWSGTMVRCITLCGQHLLLLHARGFAEIRYIRVEPGQFLLANLEFIEFERSTGPYILGMLRKIQVLGHVKLVRASLPDNE